jgi:hypothetical protein
MDLLRAAWRYYSGADLREAMAAEAAEAARARRASAARAFGSNPNQTAERDAR